MKGTEIGNFLINCLTQQIYVQYLVCMDFNFCFVFCKDGSADLCEKVTAEGEELRSEERAPVEPGQGDGAGHQLPPGVVPGLCPGGGQGEVGVEELLWLRQEVVVSQGRGVATLITVLA